MPQLSKVLIPQLYRLVMLQSTKQLIPQLRKVSIPQLYRLVMLQSTKQLILQLSKLQLITELLSNPKHLLQQKNQHKLHQNNQHKCRNEDENVRFLGVQKDLFIAITR